MMGVRDTELGDFQRAARILLNVGIVTQKQVGERDWKVVRRYAEPLKDAFLELAGYRVEVSTTTVALIRRADRFSEAPVFRTPSGRPFDRVRYALMLLVLAALGRLGQQTTLTDLAVRVRRSAEKTPGLPFDPDTHVSRLALGHAVRALEELGAVSLMDGSLKAWENTAADGEALYNIDRSVCRRLFPIAVRREDGTPQFLYRDPVDLGVTPARRARRQRLFRRLLEQPVVYVSDLNEDERNYMKRESAQFAEQLEELTGAPLERRREGFALLDPGRRFSDRPFPVGGSINQAALLLGARLCTLKAGLPTVEAPHGDERSDALCQSIVGALGADITRPIRPRTQRPFVTTHALDELTLSLTTELADGLKADHVEHPKRFLRDALNVLLGLDLVRRVPGGVVLMPALARFREVRVRSVAEAAGQLVLGAS